MASTADNQIQAIVAALQVFSTTTDKSSLEQANAWLQEFQHSVRAIRTVADINLTYKIAV